MRIRGCGLIEENAEILVLAYDYPRGRILALPGGGVREGETVPEAVAREFLEELGLEIEVGNLRYVGEIPAFGELPQTLHLVFEGRILAGAPRLRPEHTSAAEVLWLNQNDLAEVKLYPAINQALLQDRGQPSVPARYLGHCLSRDWL